MHNKKLKKIMTDLAAGHITQEEADEKLGKKKFIDSAYRPEMDPKIVDETRKIGMKKLIKKTQTRKLNPKGGKK